jgi:hypothetical protein
VKGGPLTNNPNTEEPTAPAAPAIAGALEAAARFDVVVIGAGQAGLSIGYLLGPPAPPFRNPQAAA